MRSAGFKSERQQHPPTNPKNRDKGRLVKYGAGQSQVPKYSLPRQIVQLPQPSTKRHPQYKRDKQQEPDLQRISPSRTSQRIGPWAQFTETCN